MRTTLVGGHGQRATEEKEHRAMETTTNLPAVLPTDAASARPRPSCPSGATSWKAMPRPLPRWRRSWPGHWRPPAARPRVPPGRWCPGSAMRFCRTTRSRRMAATSWTSCGTCRLRGSHPLTLPPTTSSSTSGRSSKRAGRQPRWQGGSRCFAELTSSWPPRGWSPGRRPRTLVRSRPLVFRRTPRRR